MLLAEVTSLATDELTDNSDVAQLCLYVWFFDGECFWEDLLRIIPLEWHAASEILFTKIASSFKKNKLDLEHVNMLVMDVVPSVAGREHRLAARMAAVAPQLIHYLIQQSLLCTKLSGELKEAMDPYRLNSLYLQLTAPPSLQVVDRNVSWI